MAGPGRGVEATGRRPRAAGGTRAAGGFRLLALPKPVSWGAAKEDGRLGDGLQDALSGAAEL